jgi:hypothetical protein
LADTVGTMSDDQFAQLNKKLDHVVSALDNKIDRVAESLGDQILKLYQHMHQEFGNLRKEMDTIHKRIDSVYNLVDADIKRREIDEQERAAMSNQLNRHHGWIKQLGNHTNTKLVPEP